MNPRLFFEDARLCMTVPGRMFVRTAAGIGLIVLLVATVLCLASGIIWLRWVGVFLALTLLDRWLHRREGDVPIPELLRRTSVNAGLALPPRVFAVLERAFDNSTIRSTDPALELSAALLAEKEIKDGLIRLDLDPRDITAKADELLKREEARAVLTRDGRILVLGKVLEKAFKTAAENGHNFIRATDVFSALAGDGSGLTTRLFTIFSIESGDLERALIFSSARDYKGIFGRMPAELSGIVLPAARGSRHRIMNRAWTARPTPTLDMYGMDYTDAAREQTVGFLIGHDQEYKHVATVLSRESNPNALLVGEEGSGKETIIAHLAFEIEKDEVPPALFDKRLVSLDVARLIAGGSPEELQAKLQKIISEIELAGNVILLIPDIHNLVKTSGAGYMSAADALLPIIRSNNFPILGTTFPRDYRNAIEPRSDFAGMFETVEVKEVSEEEAERILVYQALILEAESKLVITFGAIKTAVKLAKKYFANLMLPGSAVELLKSAVTAAKSQNEKVVNHETVIRAAETRVNVPMHEATREEGEKLMHLEETIHARLIGQEEAVKSVADALRQYRSGLARKGGPIASFLFVGPTGVGKTELAKILADVQFGSEKAMLRFDMTEFKDKESLMRFIGSPDGSVPGALTEAVKKQPYGLVLLDEFEKASPEILDLFLQVLDDGRLTDANGRTASFENMIIIATSNAHSDLINEALRKGESVPEIADYLKSRLTDVLKPELLNRFSRIVVFHDLRMEDMQKISALELRKVSRSLEDRGITLNFGEDVVSQMAKWGYDPVFGARPLRRAIDEHLRGPLAEWVLKANPPRGAEVKVGAEGNSLTFTAS